MIYAATQKGIGKSENEDRMIINQSIIACGTFKAKLCNGIFAIADGVGGNKAGAVASHFVANKLCTLKEVTNNALTKINEELLQLSNQLKQYHKMATTLSGIYISEKAIQLFSIGNTRVYLLQTRKYLKQLTIDDTTLNYLLSTGRLSPEEAQIFDRKSEITACFGGGNSSLFQIKINSIENLNAPFMITSDGIHDYISVDQMEDILEEFGISEKTCETLLTIARENGSKDDRSVILGEYL